MENISQIKRLSKQYKIPQEDVILIGLNYLGAQANIPDTRIRFKLKLNTSNELFYLSICINTGKTPFFIKKNNLYFYNKQIGKIIEKEKDTCDATYFRRNKTALTLNSNSRSQCQGCKFCGTYRQEAEDIFNLLSPEHLSLHITHILQENNLKDLSKVMDIGICTGCFKNEKETLSHILMARRVLRKFGFNQELKYIGSQITSKASLDVLKKEAQPFSLYLTIECFTRRQELLKYQKARLNLLQARNILKNAKANSFNTAILCILGLDPLKVVVKEIKRFLPFLNRFPLINVFQNYLPQHEFLRAPEVKDINYYLKARKELEKIFKNTHLRPRPWEDYRSLWYTTFDDERIKDIRI